MLCVCLCACTRSLRLFVLQQDNPFFGHVPASLREVEISLPFWNLLYEETVNTYIEWGNQLTYLKIIGPGSAYDILTILFMYFIVSIY